MKIMLAVLSGRFNSEREEKSSRSSVCVFKMGET